MLLLLGMLPIPHTYKVQAMATTQVTESWGGAQAPSLFGMSKAAATCLMQFNDYVAQRESAERCCPDPPIEESSIASPSSHRGPAGDLSQT